MVNCNLKYFSILFNQKTIGCHHVTEYLTKKVNTGRFPLAHTLRTLLYDSSIGKVAGSPRALGVYSWDHWSPLHISVEQEVWLGLLPSKSSHLLKSPSPGDSNTQPVRDFLSSSPDNLGRTTFRMEAMFSVYFISPQSRGHDNDRKYFLDNLTYKWIIIFAFQITVFGCLSYSIT